MKKLTELHFLIVEDNKLLAEIHESILKEAGCKVTVLTSSKEALSQIPNLQPDCIISDILMPDLDGFDLFQAIQKIKNIKKPVFIILTGKIFSYDRRRAFKLGIDGYLTKPVNQVTFANEVLDVINKK